MGVRLSAEFLTNQFEQLPSTPSIASTSETKAEFSLMESPGDKSIPK